jgi:hypothetical protein
MNTNNNELNKYKFQAYSFSFSPEGLNPKDSLVIQDILRFTTNLKKKNASIKLIYEDGMMYHIPEAILDLAGEHILKINSVNVKETLNSAYKETKSYPQKISFIINIPDFHARYQIENFKGQIIKSSEIDRFVYDDFLSLLKLENITTSFGENRIKQPDNDIKNGEIRYKVQLGVFPNSLPKDYFQKKYFINNIVDEIFFEGLYYYTIGNFSKKEKATELKNILRNKNKHPDAFVVKYISNYRQY